MTGRVLRAGLAAAGVTLELVTADLPAGMYMVRVEDAAQVQNFRLVKE